MTAAPARVQLGLLLRLHFKVLRRRATATPGRTLVTFLLVGLGTVASLLLGGTVMASLWVARHKSNFSPGAMDEAVHLAFALAYGILVLSPAMGFRGNEFLDVTKIFHLPVSHRTVFTASTMGTCLSGAVLFWLPPLAGVVAGALLPLQGWSGRPDFARLDYGVFALRMLLVLAFLFHAVAVGQVVVLLLLDLLRSRKFQDLGMVLAPVVGGAIYLGTWFLLFRGRRRIIYGASWTREFLASQPSDWFRFLPSRWVTDAMADSGPGGISAWLPFLLGFVPLTLLALLVAARLQERAFHGEVPSPEVARGGSGRRVPGGALLRRFLPDPVLAVASKEFRLLRREPIVKTVLIGQAFFLALPVLAVALRPRAAEDSVGTVAEISWTLPFLLVFVENTLTMNLLGLEGAGIAHLRTTPASWRRVLAGKDLCYLLVFGTANALFSTAALLVLGAFRPEKVPDPWASAGLAVVGGTAALAVVVAVGNVLSVAMPTSLAARGRMALRQQSSFSEGCTEKLVRAAVFAGTLVLVAPVPLALHVLPAFSEWFQEPWWTAVGAVFSLAYAAVLLRRSFPLAERIAREGEEAILERLARPGE